LGGECHPEDDLLGYTRRYTLGRTRGKM
jgi:hypothetical protein